MDFYNVTDFKEKCKVYDIYLSDEQTQKFMDYYKLLVEWNSFMNLTAITDFDEVILKHFVDSLAVCQADVFQNKLNMDDLFHVKENDLVEDKDVNRDRLYFDSKEKIIEDRNKIRSENKKNISLIDVGTGAGFPGIPLNIVFPDLKITLLDSLNKRVNFLNTIIDKLQLKNIQAFHGRAEDFARKQDDREQYDFCVSRAVANLSTLTELCIPFVKKGGYFISYKSEKVKEELSAAEKAIGVLGGKLENVLKYRLSDSDINRSLVLIYKEKNTPKRYPRKAGTPAREPIK